MSEEQKAIPAEMVTTKSASSNLGIYSSLERFAEVQRMAETLAKSDMIPEAYKEKPHNVILAMDMAFRMNAHPFQVMQNLDIIYGKPRWAGKFVIGLLNGCGRFGPIQFEFFGKQGTPDYGCKVKTTLKPSGEEIEGPPVTWAMVVAEKWDQPKKGHPSKWTTMPDLMFRYRAASFFGNTFAPDLLSGIQSEDEVIDVEHQEVPTAQDTSYLKEKQRFEKWIEEAETLEKLMQIKEDVRKHPDLHEKFNLKYTEFKQQQDNEEAKDQSESGGEADDQQAGSGDNGEGKSNPEGTKPKKDRQRKPAKDEGPATNGKTGSGAATTAKKG